MFHRGCAVPVALALVGALTLSCSREPLPSPEEVAASAAPLPGEVVARVRAATVWVGTPDSAVSGAWVGIREGTEAVVVTSAGVLAPEGGVAYSSVEVVFDGDTSRHPENEARVLAVDKGADLALLTLPLPKSGQPLPLGLAPLAADTPLHVAGFSFGMRFGADGERPQATVDPGRWAPRGPWRPGLPSSFLPLVAGLNPGARGGPVVDAQGRLRGIATTYPEGSGEHFLVPVEKVRALMLTTGSSTSFPWEATPASVAPRPLTPAPGALEALSRSVVEVRAGAGVSSGFVVGTRGGKLLVLCNLHAVLDVSSAPLGPIEVLALGAGGERLRGVGELLRSDALEDFALLQVTGLPALPALALGDDRELAETAPLWVLAMSPEKAVRTSVSGRRQEMGKEGALLQVNVGIDPEHTGGPVVDARGTVVGLAVWRHPRMYANAVLPRSRLRRWFTGSLLGGALEITHDGVDRCLVSLGLVRDDPMNNFAKVGLVMLAPGMTVSTALGEVPLSEETRLLWTTSLQEGESLPRAVLEPCRQDETRGFQVWGERLDGSRQVVPAFFVPLAKHARQVFTDGPSSPDTERALAPITLSAAPFPGWSPSRCAGEASVCARDCALEGGAASCVTAGDLTFTGRGGGARDAEAARLLYLKACEAQEVDGCERLLALYPESAPGRPFAETVAALHRRMCERGRLPSCFAEALALWRNEGVVDGARRAVKSFASLCQRNEPRSCVMRGVAHETGRGVEADRTRAGPDYRRACDAGLDVGCHDLAQFNLADAQPESLVLARQLLTDACGRGFVPSCNDLGRMLRRGEGGPADPARAAMLFTWACKAGEARACRNRAQRTPAKLEAVGGPLEATFGAPSLAPPALR